MARVASWFSCSRKLRLSGPAGAISAVDLARCCEAMPPDGRLLVIDRLLEEPVDLMSGFYDLHMLQQIGGRERTAAEVRSLLADAGLQMRRVIVPTTREEIAGLMANLLDVATPPTGATKLTDWIAAHAGSLGRRYTSELARRTDRVGAYRCN